MSITIKSALKSTVNYPIPDDRIEKALIDAELNGDAIYTKPDERIIDLVTAGLILTICTSANVSEGGYSISLSDRDGLLAIRSKLLVKWGELDELSPTVYDGTNLW